MKNILKIANILVKILEAPFTILQLTFPSNNPLSAKFIKWSNTLKQIVVNLPTICLSVFDHFSGLALKRLTNTTDNMNQTQTRQSNPIRQIYIYIYIIFHVMEILFSYDRKKTNKIRLTYTQTVKSRGKKNTIGIYNKIYVKQNF